MSFRQSTLRAAPFALLATFLTARAFAAPASDSAYVTDSQQSYVQDETSKGIQQVNMITCIMSGLRSDALVNQPTYLALVDEVKCDSEKSGSGSDGSQAASQFMVGTVNSSRASNTAPMITKGWLDEDSEDGHRLIYVHISATEAPSVTNPYGAFRLDFCGHMVPDGGNGCLMNGFLEGANAGLKYFETEDEGNGPRTIAMNLATSGTTAGSGEQKLVENGQAATDFKFAYDSELFLRGDGISPDQCFSRDARDPDTGFSVGQYGLYDTNGARVNLNSGFPIDYTAGGVKYHGFIGYGGLSLPAAANDALQSGDTVQKIDYTGGNAVATNYTVVKSGGRLSKFTKRTSTLGALDHIRFQAFVGFDGTALFQGAQANTQYEVYWDEAQAKFVVTAQVMCSQNGCQTQPFAEGQEPLTTGAYWATHGGVQGFSQSLGGQLFIDLQGAAPYASSTTVVFRIQDLVYPTDTTVPATLHCVQNCPTAASLHDYFFGQAQSPFAGVTNNNWNVTQAGDVVTYTRDTQSGELKDDASAAVILTDRDAFQQHGQFGNGVMSGRLYANASDAWCNPSQGDSGGFCDYAVSGADVYYQWQTGPESFAQFAAVKDSSGTFVQFDAPMQLNYHVPNEVVYGEYAGKDIVLQYGGFGNLWGVPGSCVSSHSNEPVQCDGSDDARYVSAFAIPYDLEKGRVTDVTGAHTPYLVKWLNREIRFARKSVNRCTAANLSLPANVLLPTASDLLDPSGTNSSIFIGEKPTVTSAPRVIQGEVKY